MTARRWSLVSVTVAMVALVVALFPLQAQALTVNGRFSDDNGHPLENGIEAIARAGITFGCNPPANDRFCPDETMTRAQAAAFVARALNLPDTDDDFFSDDNGHALESAINRLAEAEITLGCNPPANDRFCPNRGLTRAEFAAFLARAYDLPDTTSDRFEDDDGHVLEGAVNRVAVEGWTFGCNPPDNTLFCPNDRLTRAQSAGFVRRALDLPIPGIALPLSEWSPSACSREGDRCTLSLVVGAGTKYRVDEGLFQVLPYRGSEEAAFTSGDTDFRLTLDGNTLPLSTPPIRTTGSLAERAWLTTMTFSSGGHTMVAEWRWSGTLIQRTTAHVSAG
ncbi:MAG: S-layer homology domain-containing protein [Acidimicrobiia bacterium]